MIHCIFIKLLLNHLFYGLVSYNRVYTKLLQGCFLHYQKFAFFKCRKKMRKTFKFKAFLFVKNILIKKPIQIYITYQKVKKFNWK